MRLARLSFFFLAAALVLALVTPASACETTIPPVALAHDWPRDAYKLLFLHPPVDDPATTACRSLLADFFRQVGNTTNLKLVDLPAPVSSPQLVLFSPDDQLLFRSGPDVTLDTLMSLVSSPARRDLVKLFEKNDVVVLLVQGSDPADPARKTVQASVKTCTALFQTAPVLLSVRADDPAEKPLIANLGVSPDDRRSHVFVLFGWAKRVERDFPDVTEEKLLDRYQRLMVDTTVSWPHDFAPDLLINWTK